MKCCIIIIIKEDANIKESLHHLSLTHSFIHSTILTIIINPFIYGKAKPNR